MLLPEEKISTAPLGAVEIFKLDIEEAFERDEQVAAIYLDISNAFDDVHCDIQLEKLIKIGVSVKVLIFVRFLIYCRYVHTEINLDVPRTCYKGVKQGGILNTFFYIIYVATAAKNLPSDVFDLDYADEKVFYIITDDFEQTKPILEEAVNLVIKNLLEIGLEVSTSKTEFVLFNKPGIKLGMTTVKVKDESIVSTDAVKFLGINFDYQLTFDKDIAHILQKTNEALNIVKFLSGISWEVDPFTLIRFYKEFRRTNN